MPELPEVETVRRGLADIAPGRVVTSVRVRHPRAVRRHVSGARDFRDSLVGHTFGSVRRRGKFLWVDLAGEQRALVAHLGMSGQFRRSDKQRIVDPHARVVLRLDNGVALVFRDQRTFGWLLVDDVDASGIPRHVCHIGLDPFDDDFSIDEAATRLARSGSAIKRQLLGQTVVSGLGNIYCDEALWRARVHPETPADVLGTAACTEVLRQGREVMAAALEAGGTSFDPLYVAVNGESGWFERSLDVYGRAGSACRRCGEPIVRERFAGRSTHRCPRCQPG